MSGRSKLLDRVAKWLNAIRGVNKFYGELSMDRLRSEVDRAIVNDSKNKQDCGRGDNASPAK